MWFRAEEQVSQHHFVDTSINYATSLRSSSLGCDVRVLVVGIVKFFNVSRMKLWGIHINLSRGGSGRLVSQSQHSIYELSRVASKLDFSTMRSTLCLAVDWRRCENSFCRENFTSSLLFSHIHCHHMWCHFLCWNITHRRNYRKHMWPREEQRAMKSPERQRMNMKNNN